VSHPTLRRALVGVGALVVAGLLAATAAAVLTGDTGGTQLRVDKRQQNSALQTSTTTFADVPGTAVVVAVPANSSRLIDAPFFAESRCSGPGGGGWCSLRIVAASPAGTVELRPQSGLDFAFDSDQVGTADDLFEGHAMERSARLFGSANGTTYRISVQWAVTQPSIVFRLDDWHFEVRQNA
jgi:hypothetical protein